MTDDPTHPLFDDPRLAWLARRKRRRVLLLRLWDALTKAGKDGVLRLLLEDLCAWLRCKLATLRQIMAHLTRRRLAEWEEIGEWGTFIPAADVVGWHAPALVETGTQEPVPAPRPHYPSDDPAIRRLRRESLKVGSSVVESLVESATTPPAESSTRTDDDSEDSDSRIEIDKTKGVSSISILNPSNPSKSESARDKLFQAVESDAEQWTEPEKAEALARMTGRTIRAPVGYFRKTLASVRADLAAGQEAMTLLTALEGGVAKVSPWDKSLSELEQENLAFLRKYAARQAAGGTP